MAISIITLSYNDKQNISSRAKIASHMLDGASKRRLDIKAYLVKDVNAFAMGNEKEADDYAMNFMKTRGYQPMGAVTALEKLAMMDGNKKYPLQFLSTHPSPGARAKWMRTLV